MTREEAIDIIRKNIPHLGIGAAEMTDALEELIPELRESEDERTRNEIIAFIEQAIHRGGGAPIPKEKEDKWLAYLEKQKEQKHPNGCFTCDEYKKGYEAGRLNGFTAGYNKAMKEQKSAWSEENEKIMDTIVSVLGQYIDYKAVSGTGSGYATPRYSKEIDWLKSLRPSWKPSDEQMEALKNVIRITSSGKNNDLLRTLFIDLEKLV